MKRILTLALMFGIVSGCASVGRKLDENAVAKIKKGETTRAEVLKALGSPDQMTRDGDGNVTFQYIYVRATAKASTFIPIVGAFAGGANVQNQMLMVTFGTNAVVKDLISTYGATESNTGVTTGTKADTQDVEQNKRHQ
jgi:outer membrane protein assembly factor BamE (lipoprotein component of BamABCDE complex)